MYKSIPELVRAMEKLDDFGTTQFSEYVEYSMRDDINKTEAYINSKFTSGDTDSLGRPKPFFNICIAHRNTWYRATDIDRKNIIIRATKLADELKAFLASLKLQEWMKKQNFGQFLNDWGLTLATHGSAISKFIEKDGDLHSQVLDWNNVIVDAVDFDNNPVIEKIWMTGAQLKQNKSYDKDLVKQLLENPTTRKDIGGNQKDNKSDYYCVYEIHGNLPLSFLTDDEEDDEEFAQQMHIVTFQASTDKETEAKSITFYKGKEARSPYLLSHLIKKDGQTYAGGAVKNLFEAQWMVNHSQKQIKDQLDLASKIVFQTSDGSLSNKNALVNIENGDILKHNQGEPLTMLNNKPDIGAMQSNKADWQSVANQINGVSEAMLGETPKSGTAWRQTQAVLQESHSLFELMTENKGLAIIEMMTKFVIPFFKKSLDNSKEISMVLDDYQLKQIDSRYVPAEVIRRLNAKKIQTVLSGEIYNGEQEGTDMAQLEQEVKNELVGNQRFIKPSDIKDGTWKELFKNLEWDLDIDVTGEAKDTQSALATLTTVLQTLASNPMALQDPNFKLVFSKILGLTGGVSPLEIEQAKPQMQPQPMPAMATNQY